MKPTCDLCPRAATRWYVPGDDARCGLHERSEAASVPLTRRPPPPSRPMPGVADLDDLRRLLDQAPTVVPPADERCPRCSRILIAAPCSCLSPAARWLATQTSADQQWWALLAEERIEAIRLKSAAQEQARERREQEGRPCTS